VKEFLTYEQMTEYYDSVLEQITKDTFDPHVIVPIVRGGLDMGVYLSHRIFDIPVIPVVYQTRDKQIMDHNPINNVHELAKQLMHYRSGFTNILIVDEICDSGVTLEKVKGIFTRTRCIVRDCEEIVHAEANNGEQEWAEVLCWDHSSQGDGLWPDFEDPMPELRERLAKRPPTHFIKAATAISDQKHLDKNLVDFTGCTINRSTDKQWFVFPWEEQ
jgi:hypoxanthine phosphoribosyltransferase